MENLLKELKNYLDITWEDEQLDVKLEGLLKRGQYFLNNTAGTVLSYDTDETPKQLLFDFVMYARAGALSDFAENYGKDLITLQLREAVRRACSEQETADVHERRFGNL